MTVGTKPIEQNFTVVLVYYLRAVQGSSNFWDLGWNPKVSKIKAIKPYFPVLLFIKVILTFECIEILVYDKWSYVLVVQDSLTSESVWIIMAFQMKALEQNDFMWYRSVFNLFIGVIALEHFPGFKDWDFQLFLVNGCIPLPSTFLSV